MVKDGERRGRACLGGGRISEATMQEPMVGTHSSPPPACRLRIVCLFQGAVDVVCALGLQSCLVGRSHLCTGPAFFLALPCVSSGDSRGSADASPQCNFNNQIAFDRYVNWELLQELKPDLIFSQGPSREDTCRPLLSSQLTEKKCRIVSLQSHTVEEVFQNTETIASYCGVKKEGARLVTLLRSQWKTVKQITPQWADGMPHVSVAFLSSVNPLTGAGYWVPEIISGAGGSSAFGSAGCPSKSLTLGYLAQTNPDVIIYLTYSLHAGSLATELSWLYTNKEFTNLKAIKANRFFLVDASRFFIDSAPNVVSSTELLTEILHGFGYGHEGKGFIRWQSSIDSIEKHDDKILLEGSNLENKLPPLLTNKGAVPKYMDVDKHEVCSSASHDFPKYVTNVYEVRKAAISREGDKPLRDFREKPDVWDGGLEVLQSKKDDILLEHSLAKGCQLNIDGCLETKIITPDKSFQAKNTHSKGSEEHALDWHEDWENPMTEELSPNGKYREMGQVFLSPMNSVNVGDQKGKNTDLRLAQTRGCHTTGSHQSQEQGVLGRVAKSAVHRYESSNGDGCCDKQLISKIWAFTEIAAEMRRSTSFTSKQKVFYKSVSLPVSRRSATNSNANNVARLSAEVPQKHDSFPIHVDDEKPLVARASHKLSARDSNVGDAKRDKTRATQSFTVRGREERGSSDVVLKRRFSYSVPSSPRLDITSRVSRHVRDLVLKSLVELKHLDCLLLSGGLASSILAEAVPLVHSKGFRTGFTVVAGPAATDRASAAVAAKCKGMQHVILGEGEKGFAVFLLAKELAFIVETLKTFDPLQIRNLVPIAAALREAKGRGFEHVITGDGLDELLFRESILQKDVHLGLTKILSRATSLLGEALGLKVVQPFLHPKLVRECKELIHRCGLGSGPREHTRIILREAFPELSAACSEKAFNEVDSGMFYVSDYFSSAISASVFESKAKSIFGKERVRIRDAEHLVYFRAFRKVFKGNTPRGLVRWASRPCPGCGYELSTKMSWYCLVCGLSQHSQESSMTQQEMERSRKAHQEEKPLLIEERRGRRQISHGRLAGEIYKASDGVDCDRINEMSSVASIGSAKADSRNASKRNPTTNDAQHRSLATKSISRRRSQTQTSSNERKPNYWALLGAGSAGLLLLLQLARRQ